MPRLSSLSSAEVGALAQLVEQDRLGEAEQRIRVLLSEHPDSGLLWKILGVALVRQGKDALHPLLRAAELLPLDAEAHRNLGAALYDREQWAAALLSLQTALALQPDDVGSLIDAGNASRALGRAAEAVPLYQAALKLDPHSAEAQNNLGNAFLELDRCQEAADCYRRALALKPDDAQVLGNLGNALWRAGHADEALAAGRRAVELAPELDAAHNNLGLVLASRGDREEAAACFMRAVKLNPAYTEAWSSLGDTWRDLGARREALACYARAVELDPRRADSHCKFGNILFDLRRVEEAVACYRRSLAANPRHAPAHAAMAVALRQLRRPDEAEASCRAALQVDPRFVEALALLGELQADRGRFAEAESSFRQVLGIDPGFAPAYASIATHRHMTLEDGDWFRGASALLARHPPLAHEINLHYALGKYSDDLGRYEQAFHHYRQANELSKRYGARYSGEEFSRLVDRIIGRIDGAFMERCHRQASGSELPVFIIGMPRSGTSLAEQILASHPAVHGAGELAYWHSAFGAFGRAERAGRDPGESIAELANDCLAQLGALAPGARRVIDKMPANFLYAGLIHAAFPRARIIHMRRHPLDTGLSIYFQNFFNIGPYANDLADIAHYYRQYLRIMAHWRSLLPTSALLEVPYEGLVEDSESWSRRMVEFLGLPWDERCLAFHETERVVVTASKWQVRQKISRASIGRWRHYAESIGDFGFPLNS
jgi:tetratricopeptide (TPR) repeat protein